VDAIGEESSGAVSMAADLRGRSGAAAAEQTSVMVGLAAEYSQTYFLTILSTHACMYLARACVCTTQLGLTRR